MKKYIYAILSVCVLLCLTGCVNPFSRLKEILPGDPAPTVQTQETTESAQHTDTTPTAEPTVPTEKLDDPSLIMLRQAMVGTPQQFAVAYFGYALPDGNMPVDPYAVMQGAAPQLCENLPFLLQIPEQNILGTEGHLFCIVPTDENATVSVNWSKWDENTETYGEATVLYRSEKGKPILLMTTNTGWCMETEVLITDSSGEVTLWYPFIDEDNRIAPLCDENGASLYYDFSPYERLNYENLMGGDPMEMVGAWQLTWTEVEGDRHEATPGACTIQITQEEADIFRFTYLSRDFPEENIQNREMIVLPGELYPGCGNNQWIAEVTEERGDIVRYALTLLEDGTLLLQIYWEMDGMPMVSHGWYEKLN